MAFTEFCCRSGGSNLNAGTRLGDGTEPGTAAALTYASGTWVQSTGVFTVAAGDPVADGVAVGDFASVYPDAASVTPFVGRVTARTTTTITVSSAIKSGAKPVDGTTNTTLKIGGAWLGPNGSEQFPFNFAERAMVNTSGHPLRVNLKNDAAYVISTGINHNFSSTFQDRAVGFEGYASAYGDGGIAVIDANGNAIVVLTLSDRSSWVKNLHGKDNGASGSNAGIVLGSDHTMAFGCVASGIRGAGIHASGTQAQIDECETYSCNGANSSTSGGILLTSNSAFVKRCVSHDNNGAGIAAIAASFTALYVIDGCILDTNAGDGINWDNARTMSVRNCEFYNNGGDGLDISATLVRGIVENNNFIKNGGYGVLGSSDTVPIELRNNGFGAGTQANTSGATSGVNLQAIGSVTYADDVTPWVDPANGDFRINLAAAKGAGRGAFTQTAGSYAGTIGYPDIGAAQHADAAAAAPQHGNMTGGMQ